MTITFKKVFNDMEEKNKFPDFSGKCLSISTIDKSYNHDLYDPYFEYQGGRLFILGTVPERGSVSNWASGSLAAVAWDRVSEYIVFNSIEEYTSAINNTDYYNQSDEE